MSQCHDEYPLMGVYRATAEAAGPQGAHCHDLPEISVLIAESDDSTRWAVRHELERDERFGPISEVTAGDEAVRQAEMVDVVVVSLRSVCGLGALGTINRIARRPHHPTIVGLSERGEEWLSLAARSEGADDVVEWPGDGPQLARRVLHARHPAYT